MKYVFYGIFIKCVIYDIKLIEKRKISIWEIERKLGDKLWKNTGNRKMEQFVMKNVIEKRKTEQT